MIEDNPEPSRERILHVYPIINEFSDTMKQHYTVPEYNVKKNRRFNFKFNVKNNLKRPSIRRKFPHSTREHTEFEKWPYETTCPNCLNYITTKIYHYSTGVTHAVAASLVPLCMCIVPYCVNKYKNTVHYCPRCKVFLGTKFGKGRNAFYPCITN